MVIEEKQFIDNVIQAIAFMDRLIQINKTNVFYTKGIRIFIFLIYGR